MEIEGLIQVEDFISNVDIQSKKAEKLFPPPDDISCNMIEVRIFKTSPEGVERTAILYYHRIEDEGKDSWSLLSYVV